MKILVDADGCPVVDSTVALARQYGVRCLLVCDTAHRLEKDGAETLIVSKGADSVDFALVNLAQPGDIVVTQDYGLAAMCLARKARIINQNGMEYEESNIDALLLQRHIAKKLRNAGGHLKGLPKRKPEQDRAFREKLTQLLTGGKTL